MALLVATSAPFEITPGYHLALRPPPVVLSGEPFALQVEVRDGGDLAADGEIEITLEQIGGPGDVSGELVRTSQAGVATFADLLVPLPGIYTFTATSEDADMADPESLDAGPGMVPIVAVYLGDRVRLFFSLPPEPELTVTDPEAYAVEGPDGPVLVTAVLTAGLRSIDLVLDSPPEEGAGTVSVPAAATTSITGAPSIVAELSFAYGAAQDPIPPVVEDVSPPPGTVLHRSTRISFSVRDNRALGSVVVVARYDAIARADLVHDGRGWGPGYIGQREGIPGGYRYTLRCAGGWPAAPRILIYATDEAGNQVEIF